MSSDYGFLQQSIFLMNVSFTYLSGFENTQHSFICGTEKHSKIKQNWCAVHANDVGAPFLLYQ